MSDLRAQAYHDASVERWPDKAAEFRDGACRQWPECRFCNRHGGIQVGLDAAYAALSDAGEEFWRAHPNASAGALLNHLERLWLRGHKAEQHTAQAVSASAEGAASKSDKGTGAVVRRLAEADS
jgi:hypothetical protein